MQVSATDKRLKMLMRTPPGEPVKGLQPAVAIKIRMRIAVLRIADTLNQVTDAHPEWRVHRWKGSKVWSIDVSGNTRLLFDYDTRSKEINNMTYDDPH